MIYTLTVNPAIDWTYQVPELTVGEVNRADDTLAQAGGKGINVALALNQNGCPAHAIFPQGLAGELLSMQLQAAEVEHTAIPVSGKTRANITIQSADGITTKINAPGPQLTATEISRLETAVGEMIDAGDYLVVAGSLSPGMSEDFYVKLKEIADTKRVKFCLDASGPALATSMAASLSAPVAAASAGQVDSEAPHAGNTSSAKASVALGELPPPIFLLKPNATEFAELSGMQEQQLAEPEKHLSEICEQAQSLVARGITYLLLSLGEHGAMLFSESGEWWARTDQLKSDQLKPAQIKSTVGAGDATLAGFMAALSKGANAEESLAEAVKWGYLAVQLPGTQMPQLDNPDLRHPRLTVKMLPS